MAGSLFCHFKQNISPSSFDFNASFIFVTMVVLGGMGSISGSLIAAGIIAGLQELLRFVKVPLSRLVGHEVPDFRLVMFALILIMMMLLRPQGLLGRREIWEFLPQWKKKKMGDPGAAA